VTSTEQNGTKSEQNGTKWVQNGTKYNKKAVCKYCNKAFTSVKSMKRHVTYTCKNNEDEDLKELVRLLNVQLNEQKKENQSLQKQINQLSKKLQINKVTMNNNNHTNTHNNTQNNTYNIQLLNFQNTDYSHLKDKDYIRCKSLCKNHGL